MSTNRRIILSFYCDDTNPYVAGAKAFQIFLDYCAEHGIAGESSVILASKGKLMTVAPTDDETEYIRQVRRAYDCGIDSHMEVATHGGLFSFAEGRIPDRATHEGLWLHDPEITVDEYEEYFRKIIFEGEKAGIKFSGLTSPGCGCDACARRFAEFAKTGEVKPNPAAFQALLNLAKSGRFRGRAVPCFFKSSETDFNICLKADYKRYGVYDLIPNALDKFGIWENNPKHVNPDYYITADGERGIIIDHIRDGAPYCLWYSHWQGLNPVNGVGWKAFTEVIERIRTNLKDQVVWMRPSEMAERYHDACGWGFLENFKK